MTISETIAQFANNFDLRKNAPVGLIEHAKMMILDSIGVGLAASQDEFSQKLQEVIAVCSGNREGTLMLGTEKTAPAVWSALYNGSLIHSLDYDDAHAESLCHVSACLTPVSLAVAEEVKAKGRDLLTAFIIGSEIMIRLGLAAKGAFHAKGFHTTAVVGTFASAISAAKLKSLTVKQTVNALGIAGSQAGGIFEFLHNSSWVKKIHPGWAAHCGLTATALAQGGITGPSTVFEGKYGLFNTFLKGDVFDLGIILNGLNETWHLLNTGIKPYPCCNYIHASLDCIKHLMVENEVAPAEVKSVICSLPAGAIPVVCEPIDQKVSPTKLYEAKFCLPFVLAIMAVKGAVTQTTFSDESCLTDPEILGFAKKVQYRIDETVGTNPKYFSSEVELHLNNNRVFKRRQDYDRGSAKNPLTGEEVKTKFLNNTVDIMPEDRALEIMGAVSDLENLNNVDNLYSLLKCK